MKCMNCGAENEDDGRFCAACGRPLIKPGQPEKESRQQGARQEVSAASAEEQSTSFDPSLLTNYWDYLKSAIRTPSLSQPDQLKKGILTLVLFSLLLSISMMNMVNHNIHVFGMGYLDSHIHIGFDFVIKGFFVSALIIAFYALLIYFALKIANSPITYPTIIERFGKLGVPLLALSALLIIFSFLSIEIYILLFSATLIGLQIMVFVTLFSFNKSNKIDSFYLTVGLQLVFNIVLYFALKQYLYTFIGHLINTYSGY